MLTYIETLVINDPLDNNEWIEIEFIKASYKKNHVSTSIVKQTSDVIYILNLF